MLISGKAEEWSTEDLTVDIVLIYQGDNVYSPTDVGIYIQRIFFQYIAISLIVNLSNFNSNMLQMLTVFHMTI